MNTVNFYRYSVFLALLLLGFSAFYKVSYGNLALGLILILALGQYRDFYATMGRTVYFWLCAAFLLWVAARAAAQVFQTPESLILAADESLDYLKFLFLPALLTGYLFVRHPCSIPACIALVPIGFLLRIARDWQEENGNEILLGLDRARFGDSAVNFGFWGVLTLFIGIYFLHRYFSPYRPSTSWGPSEVVFGLAAVALGAACTYYSQTRTAWLVAALLCPIYIFAVILFTVRERRRALLYSGAIATALVAIGLAIAQSDIVVDRWSKAESGITTILEGNWDSIGTSSLELRARMLWEGWNAFLQRPFAGHGLGQDATLLANSADTEITNRGFTHFHNQLFWLLTETGALGGGFGVIGYLLLIRYSMTGFSPERGDIDLKLLIAMSLLALLVFSMVNMPMTSYRGPFIFALLGGAALFIRLREGRGNGQTQAPHSGHVHSALGTD